MRTGEAFRVNRLMLCAWACASLSCAELPARPAPSPDPAVQDAWLGSYAALQRLEELGRAALRQERFELASQYFASAAVHAREVPGPTGAWLRIKAAQALLKADKAEDALTQLETAALEGFRFHTFLRKSETLAPLSEHPRFTQLLQRVTDNDSDYQRHRSVESAKLKFDDVPRFWRAYDEAKKLKGLARKAAAFRRLYLAPGTEGLIDYHHLKIQSMEALVTQIQKTPDYYEGIRARTLTAERLAPRIRAGLARLVTLYPEATVPDVTFVIGRLNSGGTAGPSGMLIGLDIWSWTPGVSVQGLSPGMRALLQNSSLDDLPTIVLHEHVHALQVFSREETLLDAALAEGSADFLAGLALPDAKKPHYYRWGLENEVKVWRAFKEEMNGSSTQRWIANQNRVEKDWYADLGYFVGARICEAYYAQAPDKKQAIKALLFVTDSQQILKASGYAPSLSS